MSELQWWIAAVELPALGGLFWLLQQARRDAARAVAESTRDAEIAVGGLRDALAAYKLEVAQTYASMGYLKDVETRLTEHLLRIDAKLDLRRPGRQVSGS